MSEVEKEREEKGRREERSSLSETEAISTSGVRMVWKHRQRQCLFQVAP
jgi:hypothetical protein